MSTAFIAGWVTILVFSGVLMYFLSWAAESERFSQYRIRTPKNYKIPPLRKAINTNLNGLFSLVFLLGCFHFIGDYAFYAGLPVSATAFVGETLGVLLVYDLMYYFFHRAMHYPKVLKYVHRIHHYVKFPTAQESLFLHPAETAGGLTLLMLAIVLIGPISNTSFLIVFFVYSCTNIMVHSNLVIPHPAFRLFNFWAEKHDIHHGKLKYNYASIFPFWDQAFGTFK